MNAQHDFPALPGFADVQAAAGRLAGIVRRTPLLASTPLDGALGGRILLKVESLQRTGSFKFRGAYNRLVQLDAAQRRAEKAHETAHRYSLEEFGLRAEEFRANLGELFERFHWDAEQKSEEA